MKFSQKILGISNLQSEYFFLMIGIIIYFISRILFIESDLPLWRVLNYQPIDEFYYCINGFNLFENHLYYTPDGDITTGYAQNLFVYITLKIFGNNYFGLRMASVISGALILLLLYLVIYEFNKSTWYDSSNKRWLKILLIFYLITEFHFFVASKVLEPTIFRLLVTLLIIYYLLKANYKNLNLTSFLGALFSSIGFFFVYPTNFFLIPATFITLIFIHKTKRLQTFFWFTAGIIITFCSYIILLFVVFKMQPSEWLDKILYFKGEFGERVAFSLIPYLVNIKGLLKTSFLNNNYLLSILFIYSIPFFIKQVLNNSEKVFKIISIFLIVFILQCIFINDYPVRKLLMMLPFLIIPVFLFLNHLINNRFDIVAVYPSKKLRMLLVVLSCAYLLYTRFEFRRFDDNTPIFFVINGFSILLFISSNSFIFFCRVFIFSLSAIFLLKVAITTEVCSFLFLIIFNKKINIPIKNTKIIVEIMSIKLILFFFIILFKNSCNVEI